MSRAEYACRVPKKPPHPAAPIEFRLGPSPYVELGPLLKIVAICESGGEAKHLVQSGAVRVDGQVETRRGKKLVAGARVEARGRVVLVVR